MRQRNGLMDGAWREGGVWLDERNRSLRTGLHLANLITHSSSNENRSSQIG